MNTLFRGALALACASQFSLSLASADSNQAGDSLSVQLRSLQASVAELQRLVKDQAVRISSLEVENKALKTPAASSAQAISPATPLPGSSRAAIASFNPDLGVVGDFVATSSQSAADEEGNDRLSVREVELVLGHDIDPFARLDAVIALSDSEEVSLEEAYVTSLGLPAGFKARFGKFRPKVGRVNARHRDSLATVDEPLFVQSYFGPEGMSKTGVELSNFLPLPWEAVTHEAIIGVLEGGVGEDGTLFSETRRNPSMYARLRNAWEISDMSDFELAATLIKGSADDDSAWEVTGYGVDATFNWHLDAIRRIRFESEALFQDRRAASEQETDAIAHPHPWGMYALADYRFLERWATGLRWDYVEPISATADFARDADTAWSTYLTFFQTEFSRWRLQYQRVNFAESGHDNRFFLQGTFAIGNHKHALE